MEYVWCIYIRNTCVAAWEYGPYAILNFSVPIIAMILAATGIGIKKISDEEKEALLTEIYGTDKNLNARNATL